MAFADPFVITIAELSQFIASIATFVGVGFSCWLSWRNSKKLNSNSVTLQEVKSETNTKLDQVHAATNGLTQALLLESVKAAEARGELSGRTKEAQRISETKAEKS